MKRRRLGAPIGIPLAVLAFLLLVATARSAEDPDIARMATCRDSWFDWQNSEPARLKAFGEHFRASFSQTENEAFFAPKAEMSIAGLRVTRAFPDSVGMGVGFSVFVEAPFDRTRQILEKSLGKPFKHCEKSDNMKACDLTIADKRTLMLMAEDSPQATTTLVGCYYFYEK